ncbi:MAG: radical SAM protein [Desulfobacteraceae bacterium]|nr:radical SAM protein [Desulfobacteraceae bacterium]MBC2755226.1 radical SAM protein [Desulfobacteraceae bacterium]
MEQVDVVLFNPPFYRFCGSHNDRVPTSLCYLSMYLQENNVSHVVYNADYTGAITYWNMKWMFQNFDTFKDAVDNKGSLYGEVIEILMSFSPKTVVIMGGEPLFPTKDWGNPFIAENFAKRLKKFGIHTVGIGPFFTLDRKQFQDSFDCIMTGEPNEEIVNIVSLKATGHIKSKPMNLQTIPNLQNLYPKDQIADFVMTSFGCKHHCAFCIASKFYRQIGQKGTRYVEIDTVIQDIKQRSDTDIYLTDLDFSTTPASRMEEFSNLLRKNDILKEFTIESRVDSLTEEKVNILKRIGVKRVKLGVEGGTNDLLKSFTKGVELHQVNKAVALLKNNDISVIVYLVVGGEVAAKDYQQTREYVKNLGPDFVAVNVWAYDLTVDYRYDTQFSPVSLARWGIKPIEFFKHIDLQKEINPTVGKMIDSPC